MGHLQGSNARRLLVLWVLIGCALLAGSVAQAIAAVPTVTGKAAREVTETTASLNGTVKTDSTLTDCHFDYVDPVVYLATGFTDLSTGGSVPCEQALGSIPTNSVDHPVSAGITMPVPGEPLYFRLVAANASGSAAMPFWGGLGFGLTGFDGIVLDKSGEPAADAGSHPHTASAAFHFTSTVAQGPGGTLEAPTEDLEDARIELPPGFVDNPRGIPTCTVEQLSSGGFAAPACPPESQVGIVGVYLNGFFGEPGEPLIAPAPVYNVQAAQQGIPALFGLNLFGAVVYLYPSLRTGEDYGLTILAKKAPETLPFNGVAFTFWGVPADPSHDAERYCANGEPPCPTSAPLKPFLSLPTSCSGAVQTSLQIAGWQGGSDTASFTSHDNEGNPIGAVGCNAVDFSPGFEARPTTNVADAPSGLDVVVHLPQNENPEGTAEAHLRDVTVALPDGLVVNPSGANGLDGCSPAEVELHGKDPAHCSEASKLGRVEVDTPLLDHPLFGSVYLADPFDNPFDSLLALYVSVDDPATGLVVKLAGEVHADPDSGQLNASFEDSPQLPFEDFELHLFGGAAGVLRTPAVCGDYTANSVMTPWTAPDGAPATPADVHAIRRAPGGGACPEKPGDLPSAPSFDAGTVAPLAGANSPFVVTLGREAGTQGLDSLSLTAPPGLTATLSGIPYCPESALAAISSAPGTARPEVERPSCPAASRLGTITIGAGAGPQPLIVEGKTYLTGPYKGAPLSLAVVVPVLAGPFDLGTVVLRIVVHVDPLNAQLHLVSDPFPSILAGIPLDLRSISVAFDRPGFIRNPTSCDPMSVTGVATTMQGATVDLSNRFQLGDCSRLGFRPELDLSLSGGLRRNAHPALRAVLRADPGEAAFSKAAFTLPVGELLDTRHIRILCDRQLPPELCPAGSRLGYARLLSPLLDAPLEGPIYLREPSRRLPDLIADLQNGQFHILLHGQTAAPAGRLRIRFPALPDVPLAKAVVTLTGGTNGIFVNSETLCARPRRAAASLSAHNGTQRLLRPIVRLRGRC